MKTLLINLGKIIHIPILLYVVLMNGVFNQLIAQSETGREYKLKAYFIYTFTRYIEWNDLEEDSTFIIGIIGNSKLISPLEKIANSKLVKDKKIIVKQWDQFKNGEKCHILFISKSERKDLAKIINKVEGKHILTIGDTRGFAKQGVCINFIVVSDKIRFEINREITGNTGLKVSSQLLKLAILVD